MKAESSPGWWYPKFAMEKMLGDGPFCVFTRFFWFLIDASKF
jgi:hypothetical protein